MGDSYSSFAIEQVTATKQTLIYGGDASETPYPFVAYNVKLKR